MIERYKRFLQGVTLNSYGKAGVIMTTSSASTFILFETARILGFVDNAYVGLLSYMVFPAVFVVGLILIPVGWYMLQKSTGKTTYELLQTAFETRDLKAGIFGTNIFLTIALLTVGNIVFLSGLSIQMIHFMDEAKFCGTACHTVMGPEWQTYQNSPHSKVLCVDCHIGEGVNALINAKLNGMRQMLHASFDLYSKPIPTPVHQLRPARYTCEKCHWPEKFYGAKMKNYVHFQLDEQSTPLYTTLNIKIDAGKGRETSGIHWHIAEENEVRYISKDAKRKKIIRVDALQKDGTVRRFINRKHKGGITEEEEKEERVMDCVDCHNRATHIYQDPEWAVDELIETFAVDRSLPYIKREALSAITQNYSSDEAAMSGIENHIKVFYERKYPEIYEQKIVAIDSAVAALQRVHTRNIHPEMNIRWGTYPSHLQHERNQGCFRCHNIDMVDETGKNISNNCTLCHSILAFDEDETYKYLKPTDPDDREALMHDYLRNEFLKAQEYQSKVR